MKIPNCRAGKGVKRLDSRRLFPRLCLDLETASKPSLVIPMNLQSLEVRRPWLPAASQLKCCTPSATSRMYSDTEPKGNLAWRLLHASRIRRGTQCSDFASVVCRWVSSRTRQSGTDLIDTNPNLAYACQRQNVSRSALRFARSHVVRNSASG